MFAELNNEDVIVEENGKKAGKEENDMVMLHYEKIELCNELMLSIYFKKIRVGNPEFD